MPGNPIRRMLIKNLVFTLVALAVTASAQADVTVLNTVDPNLLNGSFAGMTTGYVSGSSIAESFVTGTSLLTLSNVVFPQIMGDGVTNQDKFSASETFALYANSTVSGSNRPAALALFNFSLQNNPNIDPYADPAHFGETTATVPTTGLALATLAPNTRYWLVLTNSTAVAWSYTTNTTYGSAMGYSLPGSSTVVTDENGGTVYNLSDGDGPQQFVLNVVPEPSTVAMLAVAGLGAFVVARRKRAASVN